MKDFKINTCLGIVPRNLEPVVEPGIFITRGATNSLEFDLSEKGNQYALSNVTQIVFALKEPTKSVVCYKYKNADGSINELFSTSTASKIILQLTPEISSQMIASDYYTEFEVATTLKNGNVLIDRMPLIQILDSIYADTL